ncbi:MAG: carboxynorspermidine decarboxylase [Sandaracinaceae bacterium]|nr:carboxynorspermidine decarboxylase [Sandaracinaceae bacterium]
MHGIDVTHIETPAFVIDLGALEDNLRILGQVQEEAGCKILLALKGYATFSTFGLVKKYLAGATSSSPHEAQLAREELGLEVHAYAPAYSNTDMTEILRFAEHVVVNSPAQLRQHGDRVREAGVDMGLRINPEHSEVAVPLYDPCAPGSRLGTTRAAFDAAGVKAEELDGLHFHTLCELGSDALERTLAAVEKGFGDIIPKMKWVNFGGGHHITRPEYDRALLVRLVKDFKQRYGVEVYLEPGEAIGIRTGILVSRVLDIVENGGVHAAILDTSATAHMPDVLEMPYRPDVVGGALPGEKAHTYRLGGLTCLAGDVVGDYSFDAPLQIGDKITFLDMAHYTMVKTSTFNGVRLPDIALWDPATKTHEVVRRFGYQDYKSRLG